MHVRFSDDARADLRAIQAYINERNPVAAQRVIDAILLIAYQLESFPLLGRPGECRERAKFLCRNIPIFSSTRSPMSFTSMSKRCFMADDFIRRSRIDVAAQAFPAFPHARTLSKQQPLKTIHAEKRPSMPTVAPLDLEGHIVGAHFLGDVPFFTSASGEVHRLDMGHKTVAAHQGLLASIKDDASNTLVTSGEDGKVNRVHADGRVELLAEEPRKWISVIAAGPQGAVAYGLGKEAKVRLADGTVKSFAEQRTVEAIAFAPKGLRIAAARYNGVTLHWVMTAGAPIDLDWKGAHNAVTFSPDGRFVVTAMQENALHGWKIDVKPARKRGNMRMTGYPAKIKSLSWSVKASGSHPPARLRPLSGRFRPRMADGQAAAGARHAWKHHGDGCVLPSGGRGRGHRLHRRHDPSGPFCRREGSCAAPSGQGGDHVHGVVQVRQLLAFASEAGDCGVVDIAG